MGRPTQKMALGNWNCLDYSGFWRFAFILFATWRIVFDGLWIRSIFREHQAFENGVF